MVARRLGGPLNQKEFAALLGRVPSAVCHWELGLHPPGRTSIAKIEALAGVEPGDFYRPPARDWRRWEEWVETQEKAS
jgi:transcriptional regulator with XRE-family HTH domain